MPKGSVGPKSFCSVGDAESLKGKPKKKKKKENLGMDLLEKLFLD